MLYIPNKFLFIHIPRSAGNSITRTLVIELIDYSDLVFCTWDQWPIRRHMRLCDAKSYLNMDLNTTQIVAVYRDEDEIMKSYFNLHKHAPISSHTPPQIAEIIILAKNDNFEDFKKIIRKRRNNQNAWEHWVGDGDGVYKVPFTELDTYWPKICNMAGCRKVPVLNKTDFQKELFRSLC